MVRGYPQCPFFLLELYLGMRGYTESTSAVKDYTRNRQFSVAEYGDI